MKKLLGILVLGLLWCNLSFAESYGRKMWRNYVNDFNASSIYDICKKRRQSAVKAGDYEFMMIYAECMYYEENRFFKKNGLFHGKMYDIINLAFDRIHKEGHRLAVSHDILSRDSKYATNIWKEFITYRNRVIKARDEDLIRAIDKWDRETSDAAIKSKQQKTSSKKNSGNNILWYVLGFGVIMIAVLVARSKARGTTESKSTKTTVRTKRLKEDLDDDLVNKLNNLKKFYKEGTLSKEEFMKAKNKLLK